MVQPIVIVLVLGLAGGLAIVTGWWRRAFVVFAIRPTQMTVERLGLRVSEREDVRRVDAILRSFAGGFNAMISGPLATSCQTYCDSLPTLYRPFAQEGTAMGYTLRHLFRYTPESFEELVVKPRPEYRYLYYVGLGFWSGMRNHTPARLERVTEGLDPLHRYLCFDGYGFKHAFFDYRKHPESLRRLDGLAGYAKNAAYHGVGRAFFFLYMSTPDLMIENMGRLGEHSIDAAAGVGLASVFVNPDRLEVARNLGAKMPAEWRDHFHLGMCFALKARMLNDLDRFVHDVSRLDRPVREAVYASIRECDRIELQVRAADPQEEGYRRWRGRVTAWMAGNIEYPLAGMKAEETRSHAGPTTPPRKREVPQ